MCAQAADRSPRLAETISAYASKCRERGQDLPDRWLGGNWDKGDQDDETVSRRVREKAEQLRAAIGDMKTPGAIRLVAQALQHAYERAGDLAGALLQESGDFEALVPDWEERLTEACEEAVSEAREEWQRKQAGTVDAVRRQVVAVAQEIEDLKAWQVAGASTADYLSGMSAGVGAGF